jgi:hypothetical protein
MNHKMTPKKSILKGPKLDRTPPVADVEPPPSIERYRRVTTQQLLETDGPDRITVITSNEPDLLEYPPFDYKKSAAAPVEDGSMTGSSSVEEDNPVQGNLSLDHGSDDAQNHHHPLVNHIKQRQQQEQRRSRGMDPETGGAQVVGRLQLDP